MMLTKEECMKALSELSEYAEKGREYHGAKGQSVDTYVDERVTLIADIICGYFSNPPLKFEELKEGMFVWDKKNKEWRQVNFAGVVGKDDELMFYEDVFKKGVKIVAFKNFRSVVFEENRFYRKEVQ